MEQPAGLKHRFVAARPSVLSAQQQQQQEAIEKTNSIRQEDGSHQQESEPIVPLKPALRPMSPNKGPLPKSGSLFFFFHLV